MMCRANGRAVGVALLFVGLVAAPVIAQEQATFDPSNREDIGDWVVECVEGADPGPGACQLYQRVMTQNPEIAAMATALAWSPEENVLRLQVSLPLGTDLRKQPLLRVDGTPTVAFPWSRCNSSGCLVEEPLSQEVLTALAQAQAASITIAPPNSGPIEIPISLAGFSDGLVEIMPATALPESKQTATD